GAGGEIEAAGTPLSPTQLGDADLDPFRPGRRVPGRSHPADPLPAGHGRQALPGRTEIRGLLERTLKVLRDPGLRPLLLGDELTVHRVAELEACLLRDPGVQGDPVPPAAVRLDDRLERMTVERGADGDLSP